METVRRAFILFVLRSFLYKWFLRWVLPRIRLSTRLPRMNGRSYQRGYAALKPGDFVFTCTGNKLSSLLIPGLVDHVALCTGKGGGFEIIEMIALGFNKCHFFDLCHEADRIIIARVPKWDGEYRRQVIEKGLSFEHTTKGYDQEFDSGEDWYLYCSELAAKADFAGTLKLDWSDLAGLGRKYISPQGLLTCQDVLIVFDSQERELEGLTGDQIEWKMQKLSSKVS